MKKVDLNVDIGEGFPHDEALLEFATSANVCLGYHAGSTQLTIHTLDLCWRKRIRVGAHPGFPDRESMGRKSISSVSANEAGRWLRSVNDQLIFADFINEIAYCKPHGALYNDSCIPLSRRVIGLRELFLNQFAREGYDEWIREQPESRLIRLLQMTKKPLMGMPNSAHELVSPRHQLIREGFADRRYLAEGTLVSRTEPNAILEDPVEIAGQVLRIAPKVDSICLHGDTPHCLEFAELVYKTLKDAGYEVGF